MMYHEPVLLQEILDMLDSHPGITLYIDATLGAAGHASSILKAHPNAKIIGFDQDEDARKIALQVLENEINRVEIIAENFSLIGNLKLRESWNGADALLFDLGVSNMQLSRSQRGFSFNEEGPLDMRMNCCTGNNELTAKDILESYDIRELNKIFKMYGEERFSYLLAKGIVRFRERGGVLENTIDLVTLIREILPAPVQRKMKGHPARRIFQALRIEVNDELAVLEKAIQSIPSIAAPGCRVIFLSYHSLEDRIVKHQFRKWRQESLGKEINKKPILPSEEEIERNRKARSAKLRGFQFHETHNSYERGDR